MKSPGIGIFSRRDDEHTMAVLTALPSEAKPLLIDVALEGIEFVTSLSDDGFLSMRSKNGNLYDLSGVHTWWNRRPQFRSHPEATPQTSLAQESEIAQFWLGVWGTASGRWCNPVDAPIANNKLRQLRLARDVGLAVPKTLWSNDPARIREFWEANGGDVVIKMFVGSASAWEPTRLLTKEILERSDELRFAPSIFQSVVSGDLEYRVVIFGDECFSVATRVGNSRYPYDVRIDTKSEKFAFKPSSDLILKLRDFLSKAGLLYGAFDVREDADGRPVFIEVNPMGQFLYLDRYLDGRILKGFCDFLMLGRTATTGRNCSIDKSMEAWLGGIGMPYFMASGDRVTHLL